MSPTSFMDVEWQSYRDRVIPQDAHAYQLTESRRAFYAGAWAFYMLIMEGLSPGPEAMPSDVKLLKTLDKELREFTADVRDGRA